MEVISAEKHELTSSEVILKRFDANIQGASDKCCCICQAFVGATKSLVLSEVLKDSEIRERFQTYLPEIDLENADDSVLCGTCQKAVLDLTRTATKSFKKECSGNEKNYVYDEFIEDEKFFEVFDHIVKAEPDTHVLTVRILKDEKIDQLCQVFVRKSRLRYGKRYEDTKYRLPKQKSIAQKEFSEGSKFKCLYCFESQQTGSNFWKHMRTCSKKPPKKITWHTCEKCPYKSKSRRHMSMHMIVHLDVNRYKCNKCSFRTKSKRYLEKHFSRIHSNIYYECNLCDFRTKDKEYSKKHTLIHKSNDEVEMYKCHLCPYQAKFKQYLLRHVLIHKTDEEITKWFQCNVCEKRFRKYCILWVHKRTHENPTDSKGHNCPNCGYQFSWKYHLKRHLTHCNYPYKSIRKADYRKHEIVPDSKLGTKMFSCEKCDYKTKCRSSLKNHRLVHMNPAEINWYYCRSCDYKSKWKHTVITHEIIHKKEEEVVMHKCKQCDYKAKRKGYLTKHMIVHKDLDESAFSCFKCGRKFKTKSRWNHHQRVHENKFGAEIHN